MKNEKNLAMAKLVLSMVIFGTIGIFRRYIPLSSGVIAMTRGFVGAAVLLLAVLITGKKLSPASIWENLLLLCLSGGAMGFNWILLFEAYNYTSVAAATLCYYMAPIFIILLSPAVLGEKLTAKRGLCVFLALIGMVLVSGVLGAGFTGAGELRGVLLGLGAAVLYASVILMNKRMKPIPAYDRTILQLFSAAAVLLVYNLFTGELKGLAFTPLSLTTLAVVCVIHTGLAYGLYFASMDKLPAQALALFSYIDPVVAVLLSALLLHEDMTVLTALGAVLVLGGAILSELPERKPRETGC